METIRQTGDYSILQAAGGSFRIVPRCAEARDTLEHVLRDEGFDLELDPMGDDGSYDIRRDNPFRLARAVDRCEARLSVQRCSRT